MTNSLDAFERDLLEALDDEEGQPPAALAMTLDSDLSTVLETTRALSDRGLLTREGFDTCRLTDRGRSALEAPEGPC